MFAINNVLQYEALALSLPPSGEVAKWSVSEILTIGDKRKYMRNFFGTSRRRPEKYFILYRRFHCPVLPLLLFNSAASEQMTKTYKFAVGKYYFPVLPVDFLNAARLYDYPAARLLLVGYKIFNL